jgi:hypothetical protein
MSQQSAAAQQKVVGDALPASLFLYPLLFHYSSLSLLETVKAAASVSAWSLLPLAIESLK